MAETSETRAGTAALSGPTWSSRTGGATMRIANRHIERWAPEATAARHGSLRNLGFVDRLVSPWIDAASRSASLRMFQQYRQGVGEREGMPVSWVFPRPWYQDELDWMAAARQVSSARASGRPTPQMLTTRGTYVAPQPAMPTLSTASASRVLAASAPSAMYEYVAPSLSIAQPHVAGVTADRMYSPLVPFQAAQAAHVMAAALAPLYGGSTGDTASAAARMSPGLRSVLTSMLERSARSTAVESMPMATRISASAPELVTPPAPRPEAMIGAEVQRAQQVIAEMSAQRARVVDLQRVARAAQEREAVAAAPAPAPVASTTSVATASAATASASPAGGSELSRLAQMDTSVDQKRIEARIAERLAERTRAAEASSAPAAQPAQLERQRREIDERIATATRAQAAQRLHEQARIAASLDARAEARAIAVASSASAPVVRAAEPAQPTVPAEILAAIAQLPPELAAMVSSGIGARPERAAQAIAKVGEALRAVELMVAGAARGQTMEPTRGPRLAMPAGLGGLVATVERAAPLAPVRRPIGMSAIAGLPSALPAQAPAMSAAAASARALRVPAMSWLAGPAAASPSATPAALAQAAAQTPAAIHHMAWADRWLARFAGARPRSLDAITAASAPAELRFATLANAAPDAVFVAPSFDSSVIGSSARGASAPVRAAGFAPRGDTAPAQIASHGPSAAMPADAPAMRFADDAETPDDVLAAISQAATRSRKSPAAQQAAARAEAVSGVPQSLASTAYARDTFADVVAHRAPTAPDAGMSAQLASSPYAPALQHLLALPAAPAFDVRALFGGGLAASYLAGLIAPDTHEVAVAPELPAWAAWGDARAQAFAALGDTAMPSREVADWDASYVAPTFDAPASASAVASASASAVASAFDGADALTAAPSFDAHAALAPLTTLRSALLSWQVEQHTLPTGEVETRFEPPSFAAQEPSAHVARALIESLRMPMLGDSTAAFAAGAAPEQPGIAFAAPGMIADRAEQWSVAQERSASDLSFDFVPPELVLAARVYGLGPAEAAQAARLAIAGPGQLAAMASAVDRTFVQALAIEHDRTSTAGPRAASSLPAGKIDAATVAKLEAATGSKLDAAALAKIDPATIAKLDPATREALVAALGVSAPAADKPDGRLAAVLGSASAFGIERRAPRGAFLWPAGTITALGLHAALPDGDHGMSVAALELLAAQTVAELGTYAAFAGDHPVAGVGAEAGMAAAFAASTGARASTPATAGASASEDDVLASTAAMVSSSRRSKFEALYLALGQSATGRSWSPAARAARALALAGRGEDTVSARERAAIAWDVLPAIYAAPSAEDGFAAGLQTDAAGEGGNRSGSLSTGAASARIAQRRAELREAGFVEMRPGLAPLSARAGEALGSYVSPQAPAATAATSSTREPTGALSRIPTAAPELVRTGRPSARHGGGEVEIPAWFEAAAKKMFANQSSGSSVASDISLAELTLIQSAPASALAASSRGEGSMPMPAAQSGQQDRPHDHKEEHRIDVEKVAGDVMKHVQQLMDSARSRNGEPYL